MCHGTVVCKFPATHGAEGPARPVMAKICIELTSTEIRRRKKNQQRSAKTIQTKVINIQHVFSTKKCEENEETPWPPRI